MLGKFHESFFARVDHLAPRWARVSQASRRIETRLKHSVRAAREDYGVESKIFARCKKIAKVHQIEAGTPVDQ